MSDDVAEASKRVVARYFEMWNTGDTSVAVKVLSPDWVDHAHPEVTGPHGVQKAVAQAERLSRTSTSRSRPSSVTVTWSLSLAVSIRDHISAGRRAA